MTDTWKDVEETLRAALAESQREATKAKADAERHVRDTIEAERRVDEVMNAVRAASGDGDIKSMEETIRAAGAKIENLDARVFMLEAERDDARRERDEARAEAAQLREILKTAGDRLRAFAHGLTEHSYQEMASVLYDLPASAEVAP